MKRLSASLRNGMSRTQEIYGRVLATWLQPVLPAMAAGVERFLNLPPMRWDAIDTPLTDHRINNFGPLMTRVEQDKVNAMLEDSRDSLAASEPAKPAGRGMTGRVYLDYNATAPLRPEAREAMIAAMDVVGNPSSVHAEGRAAKAIVETFAIARFIFSGLRG